MLLLVCLAIFIQEGQCVSVSDAYKEITRIVNSNVPPKGTPFPTTIPSPRRLSDKIAIVGAGPAGVHMAYLLKKRGFRNIVVYEKSGRIGGKSLTIDYRDTPHEMGTCYTHPDYEDNLIALAREYGLWDPVDIPSANVRFDVFPVPFTYSQYVIGEIMKILKTNESTVAQTALLKTIIHYCKLHRQMFGKYEGEIMRQPNHVTREALRCTFKKFLAKHNLLVLEPIFLASHTIQGYGHLDEISALYGLMWNTPVYMRALAGKFIGRSHGLTMIRSGFQNLWKTVVKKENIQVIFNANIANVKRYPNYVHLDAWFRYGLIWYKKRSYFHFLVWTPSVYTNIRRLDLCHKEWNIFSKLKPVWFSTTLFSSTYGIRGKSPIDYWVDNVNEKREHSLWAQRDSYATLTGQYGEAYRNGSLPDGPDGLFIRTGIAYQYGKTKPRNKYCLKKTLTDSLKATGASKIQIMRQKIWEYFPRFSPDDMANGALWDIFKMQGSRRTWFSGSSVNFESVKSVMEYNKLLVSKMPETIA